jgi:hypothetical protein
MIIVVPLLAVESISTCPSNKRALFSIRVNPNPKLLLFGLKPTPSSSTIIVR